MGKITIFTPNFKPERGGVAEYTYQLANGLHETGQLGSVITTVPQNSEREYQFNVVEVDTERKLGKRRGDFISVSRKLNSLIYIIKEKFTSHRSFLALLPEYWNNHILFTSLYRKESEFVISRFIECDLDYSIVLHGLDIIQLERKGLLGEICQNARLVIFNSKATRELFGRVQSHSVDESYILYPGINPDQIGSAERTSVSTLERRYGVDLQEKTVILSLARLVKRKGIDIALRALAPILDASDRCRYVIAGDGPEYDALKSEVEARGLGDTVTLTGEVTDKEKYGLLEASTFFVMPNHTRGGDDFEGFGISFIEASYFENVVIGGRSGGAVEAISEGKSGFLLDFEEEGGEEELRALMRRLLDDPDRVETLARQGRSHVLERFQAPELVAEFARSFNEMVDS